MTAAVFEARDAVNRHFSTSLSHVNSMTLMGYTPSLLAASLRTLLARGIAANLAAAPPGSSDELACALECVAQPAVMDFVLKFDAGLAGQLHETLQIALRADATGELCARDPERVCAPLARILLRAAARGGLSNADLAEWFVSRLAAGSQARLLQEAIAAGQCKFLKAVVQYSSASAVRRKLVAGELQRALLCSFSKKAPAVLPVDGEARRTLLELLVAVGSPAQLVELFRLGLAALVDAERAADKNGRDNVGDQAERALDLAQTLFALMPLAAQLVSFDVVRKRLVENARQVDTDDQEGAVTRAVVRCSDAIRATCSPDFKLVLFGCNGATS